ncbi:hypothetical protein [Sphingobacterium detergens]|uniref:CRP-like cAMP-binding protein n=1 Tax=Sphingobacterium detergens TaxID=1145106 RepID=A0A420BKC8_SPHD1|nr:hypothetical protein [Sphingobacterium detergens]RKE57178.1 CRP-like cAMP-binding protein [Sphingobacterium detergens]
MGTYYSEKEALLTFYTYWEKLHPELEDFHKRWLLKNGEIIPMTRGQILSETPHMQSTLYIVLVGILAKERYCPDRDERLIMTVALPHMGFFTTMHFFSKSPALGDIVCLKSGLVLKIPYKAIGPFRNQEKAIDTLIDLLVNKKKYQLDHLRVMDSLLISTDRYFYFADHLPQLCQALSQTEQARLLHMSVRSIRRAKQLYVRRR